jgi:hypothetical protein
LPGSAESDRSSAPRRKRQKQPAILIAASSLHNRHPSYMDARRERFTKFRSSAVEGLAPRCALYQDNVKTAINTPWFACLKSPFSFQRRNKPHNQSHARKRLRGNPPPKKTPIANYIANYDATSDQFKDIAARSQESDSKCMYGTSFLVFERTTGRWNS